MQDETHARRARTSTSETNILAIREMIEEDHRFTIWEIAARVGILCRSAQALPKSVGKMGSSPLDGRSYSKLSCVCERLLARYRREGDDFLRHIDTRDET